MIKNYFKIAWRNIAKQKTLSFINIIGLSIGIACFTLFLLYTVNEFSFDKFNKNASNIFRVYLKVQGENGEKYNYSTYHPMPLGPAMRQDMPDVEDYTRIREPWGESLVRLDNSNELRREEISYADASIFSMFSFKFIYGQPATALREMQNIVLTENKAIELFGTTNVLGRIMQIKIDDNFQPFTVSAVVENNRPNSSITFDLIGNFSFLETSSYGKRSMNNWNRASLQTFVQLRQGSGLPNNETVFLNFRKKYYPNEIKELDKEGIKWDHSKTFATYNLQPLLNIHTNTQLGGVIVESIDPKKIWLVLGIAAIVLLIACINFTTLAIGRLASRAKEVGVRKVIGGQRRQLIAQFLCEAILLAVISALVGLLIAKLLLPFFNNLSGRKLIFSFTMFPQIAWMLLFVTLFVGLLSGSYPALVLSGFRPVEVLKTKIRINGSNLFTRSLVTLQFTLSIALIISTLVILKQTNYMSNKNPGFNKENVLMVDANEIDTKKIYPLFKQTLIANTNITGIASAELGLGEGEGWSQTGFEYNGKHKQVYEFFIDKDYLNVLGMQLLVGRNFDYNITADTVTSVIINEAMMKDFGWTLADAIGQPLKGYSDQKTPVVIGVVKDFNFRSLKEKVSPQMFQAFADYTPYKFFVRIKPGNPSPALAAINKAWKSIVPDFPLKYSFLDESLDKFYKSEKRWRGIAGWAGGISIFLACLGLFGLAALTVVNRTKEIGIRKVLGASLTGIVAMVSKEFIKLVIIALVIASALAWFFMKKWLQDYAYRINLGYSVFLIAGLFAVTVALLTVGFHAVKAAIANPVKSLRTE
jgi:putative ABC transport system permease protein